MYPTSLKSSYLPFYHNQYPFTILVKVHPILLPCEFVAVTRGGKKGKRGTLSLSRQALSSLSGMFFRQKLSKIEVLYQSLFAINVGPPSTFENIPPMAVTTLPKPKLFKAALRRSQSSKAPKFRIPKSKGPQVWSSHGHILIGASL